MITTVTTNVLTWAVALLVSHYSLHENSLEAGVITAAIGIVAGAVAGYMVREIPVLERDVTAPTKI
jgi:putative flippase GtrA